MLLLAFANAFDDMNFTRTAAAVEIEGKAPDNAGKRCNELKADGPQ